MPRRLDFAGACNLPSTYRSSSVLPSFDSSDSYLDSIKLQILKCKQADAARHVQKAREKPWARSWM